MKETFPEDKHKRSIPPSKEQPAGVEQAAERLYPYKEGREVYSFSVEAVRKAFIAGASWDAWKKDAVEFSIWINQNYTLSDNPHFQQVWHKRGGLSEKKTTEELYNLFKPKHP